MDNLGRLVAAERNALAAIELAKSLSAQVADMSAENVTSRRQIVELQQQIAVLNARIAATMGTGATER